MRREISSAPRFCCFFRAIFYCCLPIEYQSLVAEKMSQYNVLLYCDIFPATRLWRRKKNAQPRLRGLCGLKQDCSHVRRDTQGARSNPTSCQLFLDSSSGRWAVLHLLCSQSHNMTEKSFQNGGLEMCGNIHYMKCKVVNFHR